MNRHNFSGYDFAKVMHYPNALYIFDLSEGYDPEFIRQKGWGVGKYNEKRPGMYDTSLFDDGRDIHMAIDIWANAGEPVFSFAHGKVVYRRDNDSEGNYGPTIVVKYKLDQTDFFALYGHLSRESLRMISIGQEVQKGQKIADLGDDSVNGGWVPHLHFQLSIEDPGEADMPGVVTEAQREEALKTYPDPRLVLGDLY
ncbi:MAG: peptidoglycan DD-metalloendopeptidase family protein [Balneolaceae bacterium]|jgi:murein DD-endopeptidase MepM/ murein hydrolase activator NlpD